MKTLPTLLLAVALAGCAEMPQQLNQLGASLNAQLAGLFPSLGASLDAPIPLDAVKGRDPLLASALAKIGQYAGKQSQPMTVTVFAPSADLDYMLRSIVVGIPPSSIARVTLVGKESNEPRVTAKVTSSRG
ncbi:hypothetical protein [Burkholderia vietnamiensis]|uniref:hypothetical protein n=1 Tax=Burkholderia vietnamiensis TaxID=60552 RepID=UPI0015938891|nr:hypothetical protein [Burkholderia vietnamiensis]